ncbi:unnamed protein product [Moneuplotes crassus]|uniref:Methyltransferase domain-containing protein n=1 Tax=Euplotes crassus TaxID=5936 RepID=A0AAD1XXN4_EUPCR|nr:unnamed protein product [Moneuplotes crassus]CAI2380461.1 unnamed protein product [Moneuplotes crassus]
MAQYGKPEFWEDRYQRDTDPFDWYQKYEGIKDIITQYINTSSTILNLGCGNSRMSEEMYEEGYENITNVDISPSVIKAMAEEYEEKCPNMKFQVADARALEFEESQFDVVIDKGTFDCILCGDRSGVNCSKTLENIYKVLNFSGIYICISYGVPDTREARFEGKDFNWKLTTHQVAKSTITANAIVKEADQNPKNYHYIYVLKKTA